MILVEYFSLWFFIFSIISVVKLLVMFVTSLLSNPPKKMDLNKSEEIFYAIMTSYIICFIINLI
jgi:hypothetical protein